MLFRVLNHTDDDKGSLARCGVDKRPLTNWVGVRKEFAGHGLVDHANALSIAAVAVGDFAAFENGDSGG